MKFKFKRTGISLIMLVITIIVIVILSGAVILSLNQNSPIAQANEATFKADLDAIKSEYNIYITSQYVKNKLYNPSKLNANDLQVAYDATILEGQTIKDIITILKQSDKYNGQFEIINGILVYVGTDRTKKRWAKEANVEVLDADRLDATISTLATLPVSAGTDISGIIKFSSNAALDRIDLAGKLELLDENNVVVDIQQAIQIGNISGTDVDTLRNVDILIKTDLLYEGRYKIRLKPYSVYNIYDVTINKDIVTNVLFEIDNTPPENPSVSVNPTTFTNGDVTLGITYPEDSIKSQYSLDGETWLDYTNSIVISENITIYARGIDIAGNQSGQTTITIANIDKKLPTVTYTPNGGENLQTISTKVLIVDIGVSNINNTSLEYVWDTQKDVEPLIGWEKFNNGDTIQKAENGTYYLWIKAVDNAGNMIVTKSSAFAGDITPPENPIMVPSATNWTNKDVTVSITYPEDAIIKEYSTDAATWHKYISPVVVATNNTSVYARGVDASGNQSGQSTITIANIDKNAPSVPIVDLNGYTPNNWTKGNIVVSLSSNDLESGIEKYQYTVDEGINWYDAQPTYTINWDYWGYTQYRSVDKAGNVSLSSAGQVLARDATAPTYSSYAITNVTGSGYDVYIYGVNDISSKVNRVQFPTWTDYNGQDDLIADWTTNPAVSGQNLGGGTWYFRVNTSSHNYEFGQYRTDVYIYDNIGNVVGFATTGANVPQETLDLYNYGDQSSSNTGGWRVLYGDTMTRSGWAGNSAYVSHTFNLNNVYLSFASMGSYQYTSTANRMLGIITNNKVDLTGYRTLNVLFDISISPYNTYNAIETMNSGMSIVTSTMNNTGYTDNSSTSGTRFDYGNSGGSTTQKVVSCDISFLSDPQYITVRLYSWLHNYNCSGNMTIYRVWLSK